MSKSDGVLTINEVKSCPGWPSDEIIEKKRVAVLECVEDIPCNPCEIVCPSGAITVGVPITNLPKIDGSKCNGCNLCIAICPGLTVFVVEKNYSDSRSVVSMPYELLPVPGKGDIVKGTNRKGEYICDAEVIKITKLKQFDKTNIVSVAVDKKFFNEVRSIRV